ncbi:MAG: YheU family protein [Phycisphaerales bacterium JB063]
MPLQIPHDELPPDTLDALIEEFVTRDGTDWTEAYRSVEQVKKLLDAGRVVITFDEESETCTILRKEDAQRQGV